MKAYAQAYWAILKRYFSQPQVARWTVAILTLAIVLGSVGVFFWTIYTKDKPAFVPEDVREEIQGAIKEGGEDIKTLSEPVGGAIVDAAFAEEPCCAASEDADSWPTYTDEELGISFKYPEGWVVDKEESAFWALDSRSVDQFESGKGSAAYTGVPYWGGLAIKIAPVAGVDLQNIQPFIENLFGVNNVSVLNQSGVYYVIDQGQDRYGGGTGYYYYKVIGSNLFEFSLDYFIGQENDGTMVDKLKIIMESASA